MAGRVARERKVRLSLNLNPEMYERLRVLAEMVGMPIATLGAVYVGEMVSSKERAISNQDKLYENFDLESMVGNMLSNPEQVALLSSALEQQK